MRSSFGAHYIALDHVRALAAFLVFAWHFLHGPAGEPVPFADVPSFAPLVLLAEGHTGVSLFMVLSGYLFARLLSGRSFRYGDFLANRALRLLPLLLVVFVLAGIRHQLATQRIADYLGSLVSGFVFPAWPNGGWSIAVELHFYVILPMLLAMATRSRWLLLLPVAIGLALRAYWHWRHGEVQTLAYWTLAGRIDQFCMGILFWHLRASIARRHGLAALVAGLLVAAIASFDRSGGFYEMQTYPSPSAWWIFLPTIEAVGYGALVAWYDNSFEHSTKSWSQWLARYGQYSYSIYLLHTFFVFDIARWIDRNLMDISNLYVCSVWSLAAFMLMVVPGHLSYRFIEEPFLKRRRPYLR